MEHTTNETPAPSPDVLADRKRFARSLVTRALESYGAEALALADAARTLVGLDGLDDIAHDLANSGDVETAWTIRGAVDALTGEDEPDEMGGAYESDACDGFDFVRAAGYGGVWSEHKPDES